MITYVSYGLNLSFLPLLTSLYLTTKDQPLSFNDFKTELLSNELFLESQYKSTSLYTNNFVLFSSKQNK